MGLHPMSMLQCSLLVQLNIYSFFKILPKFITLFEFQHVQALRFLQTKFRGLQLTNSIGNTSLLKVDLVDIIPEDDQLD